MIEEFKEYIEEYCLNDMLESVDETTDCAKLELFFVDIDYNNLQLAEFLLEKPKELIIRTKKALELIDLPNGMSVDKIKIQYVDLPMPDFNMIDSEYRN